MSVRPLHCLLPGLLLLGACDATEPDPPVPAAVRIAGDSVHLYVGEGAAVSAAALDAQGKPVSGARLVWSSSDSSVASVDSAGRVLGLRPGRAEVTASTGATGPRARIGVRVSPRPDRLELPQDTFVLPAPGPRCAQTVTATYYDRSGQRVVLPTGSFSYSVADTSVAAYTRPRGGTSQLYTIFLYGRRAGETRLAVAWGEYRDSAVVRVLPGTPSTIRITAPSTFRGYFLVGDTVQMQAQVLNECGEVVPELSATFSSGKPSVLEVDPGGRVVARAPGEAYVRAAWNTRSDSVRMTAYEVRLLPEDTTAAPGDTITYRAYRARSPGAFEPMDALFYTSDSTVAKLIGTGPTAVQRVLAAGEGEARVTAGQIGKPSARLRVVRRP